MRFAIRTATCTMVLWSCAFSYGHAQKQGDRWYFSDRLGFDFSSGEPNVLHEGAMYNDTAEGSPPIQRPVR